MSDKASIILRYDISSNKVKGKQYKGVICNHYRGYDPHGLVIRFALGLSFFLKHKNELRHISGPIERDLTYQLFRRTFDVDFINRELWVSIDGVAEAKRLLKEEATEKEKFNDALLWQDTDFGQFLIDISGTEEDAAAKYALVENIYDKENRYTVEEYIKWCRIRKDDQIQISIDCINDCATVMTSEEIRKFIETDLYEYAYYNEILFNESQKIKETVTEEDPIEELGLSVRAYNSLKRAGVVTVGQLKKMKDEEIRNCRNMGSAAFEEIKERLKNI